eukprot:m.214190 g.214190  ORF g.214190 m.214190 type:complete len:493 (-) comp17187_c0_seq2:58-1536(-)
MASVFQVVLLAAVAVASETYTAAVYQHTRIRIHDNATSTKLQNVAAYAQATAQAAQANVDIIVFPEVGLGSNEIDRALNAEYCEDVPDPSAELIPCEQSADYCSSRPALCQLSCLAKQYSLYMVVGMNDIKPCSPSQPCPKDNRLLFNTGVVFDRKGMVIQRYHKKHIFSPFPVFDVPTPAEVKSFDTDFGVEFGIFICFDMLFPDPPLELIKQGLKHYVFPTSWVNVPPLLTATQYQQAWSRSFNTTLIASNTGAVATSGSGIYSCGTIQTVFFNASGEDASDSKLLVATIPKASCQQPAASDTPVEAKAVPRPSHVDDAPPKCGLIGIEECACSVVKMTPGASGTLTAQHKNLQCKANYSFASDQPETGEYYGLIVYSGTEWFIESLPIQYCSLVKCTSNETCVVTSTSDDPTKYSASTLVEGWSITGNYTAHVEQQFPLLVVDGGAILPPNALSQGYNTISSGSGWPQRLLHTALLARTWNTTGRVREF